MSKNAMSLSAKYDALLQRFMELEDQHKQLRQVMASVHACVKSKEAIELDGMAERNPNDMESGLSITMRPAVWASIKRNLG